MLKRNSINVHSNTPQLTTDWPYSWFWKIFSGFAKSPSVLRSSWILNECNLYFKIVKYCILSEVCVIKTAPRSTVLSRMGCMKNVKGGLTRPQICSQDFVKQTYRTQKFGLICFPRISVFQVQSAVIKSHNGSEMWSKMIAILRLSTRCKVWLSLGLFAN